jgi:hypothetical protein
VNKLYFVLAPILAMIPALTTITVVPFGAYLERGGPGIPLALANVDLGLLAVFAVSSLGVYSASSSPAGPPTRSIRSSAACAPRPSSSRTSCR